MIKLTNVWGWTFYVNPELISMVQPKVLGNGKQAHELTIVGVSEPVIVFESPEEIVELWKQSKSN